MLKATLNLNVVTLKGLPGGDVTLSADGSAYQTVHDLIAILNGRMEAEIPAVTAHIAEPAPTKAKASAR